MNTAIDKPANLELLLEVPVSLLVELGTCQMTLLDILQLTPGAVVQLDSLADEPVNLFVNGKRVARGEVVVVEDNFGVKITEVAGHPVTP